MSLGCVLAVYVGLAAVGVIATRAGIQLALRRLGMPVRPARQAHQMDAAKVLHDAVSLNLDATALYNQLVQKGGGACR